MYYNRFVLFLLQSYALDIAIQQLYAHSKLPEMFFMVRFILSIFDTFRSHPFYYQVLTPDPSALYRVVSDQPRKLIAINSCALAQGKNIQAPSELNFQP